MCLTSLASANNQQASCVLKKSLTQLIDQGMVVGRVETGFRLSAALTLKEESEFPPLKFDRRACSVPTRLK